MQIQILGKNAHSSLPLNTHTRGYTPVQTPIPPQNSVSENKIQREDGSKEEVPQEKDGGSSSQNHHQSH